MLINDLLQNSTGRFSDFKKDVENVNTLFNKNYLRTEYNNAFATSQEIKKWNHFTKDNPGQLLKYVTVGDERVRQEHKALDGIVLPATHSFWNENTLPLVWNCRCTIIRASENIKATPEGKLNNIDINVDKEFQFNAAKTNQLFFIKQHSYWKSIPNKDKKTLIEDAERLFNEN